MNVKQHFKVLNDVAICGMIELIGQLVVAKMLCAY